MDASVHNMASNVAMLGWIMPAPLAKPTRLYSIEGEDGRVKVRESSFGNVSVVQMARAADSQWSWVDPRLAWACGSVETILSMGRLRCRESRARRRPGPRDDTAVR